MSPKKKLEDANMEECFSAIMMDKMYREAGLKQSEYVELEGRLFDHLCGRKSFDNKNYIYNYASELSKELSEEFSPNESWLNSFVVRFCLVRKLQPKKSDGISTENEGTVQDDACAINDDPDTTDNGKDDPSPTVDEGNTPEKDKEPISSPVDADSSTSTVIMNESANIADSCGNTVMVNEEDEDVIQIIEQDPLNQSESHVISDTESESHKYNIANVCQPKTEECTVNNNSAEESSEAEVGNNNNSSASTEVLNNNNVSSASTEVLNKSEDNVCESPPKPMVKLKPLSQLVAPKEDSFHEVFELSSSSEDGSEEKPAARQDKSSSGSDKSGSGPDKSSSGHDKSSSDHDKSSSGPDKSSSENDKEEESSEEEEESEPAVQLTKGTKLVYKKKEDIYFKKNHAELQFKSKQKVNNCTACLAAVNGSVVSVHPVLGVLICKKCLNFYGEGEFNKDEDGFDEYCRWCANGGDLLICDFCTNGFCKVCIKRNVGRSALNDAMNSDKWTCYVCDPTPLMELRAMQRIIMEEVQSTKTDHLTRSKKKEVTSENKFANFRLQREIYNKKQSKIAECKENLDFCECINDMKELLSLCFKQLEKIDFKLKQNKSGEESLITARRRFARLNKAMQSNFQKLLSAYLETANINESNLAEEKPKKTVVKNVILSDVEETVQSDGLNNNSPSSPLKEEEESKMDGSISVSADVHTAPDKKLLKGKSPIAKKSTAKRSIARKSTAKKSQISKKSTGKRKHSRSPGSAKNNSMNERSRPKRPKFDSDSEPSPKRSATINSDSDSEVETKQDKHKLKRRQISTEFSESDTKSQSILKKVTDDKSPAAVSNAKSSDDDSPKESKPAAKNSSSDDSDEEKKPSSDSVGNQDDRVEDPSSEVTKGKKSSESKSDKQALFNSDTSDEDEVNISSTVESILEDEMAPKEGSTKSRKRRRSETPPSSTSKKRTKLSLDKEAIMRHKNVKAKNTILNSSSDEAPTVTTRRRGRSEKLSTLKDNDEGEKQNSSVKPCCVKCSRLSSSVMKELKETGFSVYRKVKQTNSMRLFRKDSSDSTSDPEFKKLMRFRLNGMKAKTTPRSSGSDASDEDSDSDNETQSAAKKSVKKKKSDEPQKLADINVSEEESGESTEEEATNEPERMRNEDLNERMKKALLLTSDEESSLSSAENESGDDSPTKPKKKKKNKTDKLNISVDSKKSYKNTFGVLRMTSDDDSTTESSENSQTSNDSGSDFETDTEKKVKRRAKRRNDSDSTGSSSDADIFKKLKNRRRIKKGGSSSSDDSGGADGKNKDNKDTPSKKKVRKIMKDEDLLESTKNATQLEQSRKERVKSRQKLFEALLKDESAAEEKFGQNLVLDFDAERKKKLVCVDDRLRKHLKPHQEEGIKFMWNATIETVDLLNNDEGGGGCILAHCMGLGKTLSVISFIHTLLTTRKTCTQISNVLVCCPVNTVYNWVAEFRQWLKGRLSFDVSELISQKTLSHRAFKLDDWYKEGGVMIIGYDMFRNLTAANKKRSTRVNDILQKCLVNPGPDLAICDEGHILKNEKTALSIALNKMQTIRRIVLTGTPLQNNLKEYHCMIQFVKPNLLGSRKEYLNRFVNPIEAGQCKDADAADVRRMKRRAHILHNMLEGCVQRFDYSVIQPFLPSKHEYVVSVQMTSIQCQFYSHYLQNLAQGGPKRTGSGLFVDFSNLSKIWNHPYVLMLDRERAGDSDDEEGDLTDFIDDNSTSSSDSEKSKPPPKQEEAAVVDEPPSVSNDGKPSPEAALSGLTEDGKVKRDWWTGVLPEEKDDTNVLDNVEIGGKMVLLVNILKKCDAVGDKLLLFSQSILTLNMIEHFLGMIDSKSCPYGDESKPNFGSWKRNRDYLRLDGSTPADVRKDQCKSFNSNKNERCRLFLISTRAGGIGINLVGANRVIIFDSSWNPSHDIQSIFRIYRFGQKKECFVYRFVAQGTMEEKIYSRQVTKLATALRVVDEQQIKRNFRMDELVELYKFTPADVDIRETPKRPVDLILSDLLINHKEVIVDYHEHDSLLENQTEEELTEEERKAAWADFEREKREGDHTKVVSRDPFRPVEAFDVESYARSIVEMDPSMTEEQRRDAIRSAAQRHQKTDISAYTNLSKLMFDLKNNMRMMQNTNPQSANANEIMLNQMQMKLRLLEANIKRDTKIITQFANPALIRTPVTGRTVGSLSAQGIQAVYPRPPKVTASRMPPASTPHPAAKVMNPENFNDHIVTLE